jgi:histidyl-tRNA synthetase
MAKNETIRPVKGTRDYYPEDMAIRVWLYEKMRKVSEAFGYQEYEGPILESLELYAAKSSEEIVEKQSYVFEDRGGDKITLRPELTPTLARMVAQRQNELTFPLRWWSFGPFWRYERPQKGRTREFFQWNIDMIGDESPEADAELIIIAAKFLSEVGLEPTEAQIRINNRELMDTETSALGIPVENRQTVYQWIDRREKMKAEDWQKNGVEIGLTKEQISGVEGLLADTELWKKSDDLTHVFRVVKAYGLEDWVSFDPNIIRGFLYYTSTVFEAWDTSGEFRALFGGGRYDDLVGDVGGEKVGAVGFAVGDLVITLLLEQLGRLPEVGHTPADVFVTVFNEDLLMDSLAVAKELRDAGIKVTSHLQTDKLGKQFKYADRIGARIALVIGPDELTNGTINIKDLRTGDQETISRKELINRLKNLLEG